MAEKTKRKHAPGRSPATWGTRLLFGKSFAFETPLSLEACADRLRSLSNDQLYGRRMFGRDTVPYIIVTAFGDNVLDFEIATKYPDLGFPGGIARGTLIRDVSTGQTHVRGSVRPSLIYLLSIPPATLASPFIAYRIVFFPETIGDEFLRFTCISLGLIVVTVILWWNMFTVRAKLFRQVKDIFSKSPNRR
jgi:hypothetical protein